MLLLPTHVPDPVSQYRCARKEEQSQLQLLAESEVDVIGIGIRTSRLVFALNAVVCTMRGRTFRGLRLIVLQLLGKLT